MPQRRILVVDDEENIGRSLRLILEREGYAVSVCSSIGEARRFRSAPTCTCWTCGCPMAPASICCAAQVQ